MKTRNNHEAGRLFWLHRIVTFSAFFMIAVSVFSVTGWADALYDLADSGETVLVLSQDTELSDLPVGQVYLAQFGNSREIVLQAGQPVTIEKDGALLDTISNQERLSVLLDRMQIVREPDEMVVVDLSDSSTVAVSVKEEVTCLERQDIPSLYAIERRPSTDIPEGKELVIQEGQDGMYTCVYQVTWKNGEVIARTLVEQTADTSVPQIIAYGVAPSKAAESLVPTPSPTPTPDPVVATILNSSYDSGLETDIYDPSYENNDPSLPMDKLVDVRPNGNGGGILVFASGRTARYKSTKSMSATAYNKDEPKVGTITASGTKVHKGVVAVDRKVIPLGTRLYVVAKGYEYGYSVAEDTGVFGNTIDLYFESYKGMQQFGRRAATVYILE